MIEISTAQLDAWIAALIYPLTRILAFTASAPLFSSQGVPRRIRLTVGLVIALAVAPAIPPLPPVSPASAAGLLLLGQQMLIGVGMGFAARIVFSAIELAGEYIGFQMGLGFATFYDPTNSSQTAVIAELFNLLALLVFLALDGHLLFIAALTQSFTLMPIGAPWPTAASWRGLAEMGSLIFATGLLLALPVMVALMIANLALAVLARAAPQLNIFAVGFPITLTGGFVAIVIMLDTLPSPLQRLYETALETMHQFVGAR